MDRKRFSDLLNEISDAVSAYNFSIINHNFSESTFGNFFVVFSNGFRDFRILQDKSQNFLETKLTTHKEWELITSYVNKNYPESTLSVDLKLHKLYENDFSLKTNVKFIAKILTIEVSH